MARSLLNLFATLVVASTLYAAISGSARAVGACMDPVSAQALVTSHRIKTWHEIKAMAGISGQYTEISPARVLGVIQKNIESGK